MTVDLGGFSPDDESDDRYQRAKREFPALEGSLRGFPGLRQARALFRLMCDGKQPWHRRGLAAAGVLYLVVPLDAVPDCIPGCGLLDDLAVIIAVVLILSGVIDAYLEGDEK